MTSRLSLGRLQQPLQPPLPELQQQVLLQLPVVPPQQELRLEPEPPEETLAVRAVPVEMPDRLPTSMPITKSSKTCVAVAVTVGEFGDVAG